MFNNNNYQTKGRLKLVNKGFFTLIFSLLIQYSQHQSVRSLPDVCFYAQDQYTTQYEGIIYLNSSSYKDIQRKPYSAFDCSDNTYWSSPLGQYSGGNYTGNFNTTVDGNAIQGEWIQVYFPMPIYNKGFYFRTRGEQKQGYLVASQDGANFTTLSSGDYSFDERKYVDIYNYSNQIVAYNYFRFIFNTLLPTEFTRIVVYSFQIYGYKEPCNITCYTCIATQVCTSCYYYYYRVLIGNTCVCMGHYYDQTIQYSSPYCGTCHQSCQNCTGGYRNNCTTCNQQSYLYRVLNVSANGECQCLLGYFDTSYYAECSSCHITCSKCTSYNENACTECFSSQNRSLLTTLEWYSYYYQYVTKCRCVEHFYDVQSQTNSPVCQICHYSCQNCSSSSASNQCTSCYSNDTFLNRQSSLQNNQCLCKTGWYDNGIDLICQKCHSNCLTCNNGLIDQCLTCNSTQNRLLSSNTCSCMQKYYDTFPLDSETFCQSCHYSCNNCVGPSIFNCSDCVNNGQQYFRDTTINNLNQCLCNLGRYDDGTNLLCQRCHLTCLTCSGGQVNQCLSCDPTLFRVLNGNVCSCQEQYYDIFNTTNSAACQPCHYSCNNCTTGGAAGCIDCSQQTSNNRATVPNSQNQCTCNPSFYDDSINKFCQNCHPTCLTCLGGAGAGQIYQCLSCDTAANKRDLTSGQCVCPTNKVFDSYITDQAIVCSDCHYSCLGCNGFGVADCNTCETQSFRFKDNNFCLCKPGWYDNGVSICDTCHLTCLKCSGGNTLTHCTACSASQFRVIDNNQECVCQTGYYSIFSTGSDPICKKCHYSCSECTGEGTSTCWLCFQNANNNRKTSIEQNQCLCYDGWYDDGTNLLCAKCHITCLTCSQEASGGLIDKCLTCDAAQNRNLVVNQCSCKERYYDVYSINFLSPICLVCHYTCLNCTAGNFTSCTSCFQDATYNRATSINGQKQCNCNVGFFDDGTSQNIICQTCHATCLSCSDGAGVNQCLSCKGEHFRNLEGGTCKCQQHYYDAFSSSSNPICKPCHYSCLNCTDGNANSCLNCDQPAINQRSFSNVQCLPNPGWYDDGINVLCVECQATCYTCTGSLTSCASCNTASQYRNLVGNTCQCKESYYDVFSTSLDPICKPCHFSCQNCTADGASSCTTCQSSNNRAFSGSTGQCLCNPGWYEDSVSPNCPKCHITCTSCTNDLISGCSSCDLTTQFRTLTGQTCICIANYFDVFSATANPNCQLCHSSCYSCFTNDASSCLSCRNYLINNRAPVPINNICICNPGWYDDGINVLCLPCHKTCKTCTGPLLSQCTSCDGSAQFRQLGTTTCTCKQGYLDTFSGNSNPICQKCHYSCSSCTTQSLDTACSQCYQDSSNNRALTPISNRCSCNSGWYDDGTNIVLCLACHVQCQTCTSNSISSCSSCLLAQQRTLIVNTCNCLERYYDEFSLNDNPNCQPCHYSCFNCSTAGASSCLKCYTATSYNREVAINILNQCLCTPGWYDDGINLACVKCHATCLTCTAGLKSSCTSCNTASQFRNLVGTTCDCKEQYYDDFSVQGNPVCQHCDVSCYNCTGAGKSACSSCIEANNRAPIGSQCLCNYGWYDSGSEVCPKCHVNCKTCTTGLKTSCTACETTQFRTLAATSCTCNQNYYDVYSTTTNDPVCKACHYSCLYCTSATSKSCSQCSPITTNNRALTPFQNQCKCNSGFYDDGLNSLCLQCHMTCQTCTNGIQGSQDDKCSSCISTSQHRNLIGSTCLCQQKYYDVQITANNPICLPCHYSCFNCTQADSFSCINCNQASSNNRAIVINSLNQCLCNPGWYDDGTNLLCPKCHITCLTCNGGVNGAQINQCTSCDTTQFRNLVGNLCLCKDRYYETFSTTSNPICQPCHYSCYNCTASDSSSCTTCFQPTGNNRAVSINAQNQCTCNLGWYDVSGILLCPRCHLTCATCSGGANGGQITQCLTCDLTNQFRNKIGTSCKCIERYFDVFSSAGDPQCQRCHYSCLNCTSDKANSCLNCISPTTNNRAFSNNQCACNAGWYDDGANELCPKCPPTCLTCTAGLISSCTTCNTTSQFRNLVGKTCFCKEHYYDDFAASANPVCQPCHYSCQNCTGPSAQECITCYSLAVNSRESVIDANKQCNCQIGWFDDGLDHLLCPQCSYKCVICITNSSTCTSCFSSNILRSNNPPKCDCRGDRYEPNCKCIVGKYDDPDEKFCQNCDKTCYDCDLHKCIKCQISEHRVVDPINVKICICPLDIVDNTVNSIDNFLDQSNPTLWCTTCTVGIFKAQLSDNYENIVLNFNVKIKIVGFSTNVSIVSNLLCLHLFPQATLDQLGSLPLCNQISVDSIQITFTLNPIINSGDVIKIYPDVIQRIDCYSNFTIFPGDSSKLFKPISPLSPSIDILSPKGQLSLCQQVPLIISQKYNDGKRGFPYVNWQLIDMRPLNQTNFKKIQQFLDQNINQLINGLSLTIPPLILVEFTSYTIQISFNNTFGSYGKGQVSFETLSNKGPVAEIVQTAPFLFNTWKDNQISANIYFLQCETAGQIIQTSMSLRIIWYESAGEQDSLWNEVMNYISKEDELTTEFKIPKFSKDILTSSKLKLVAIWEKGSNPLKVESQAFYSIVSTPLVAYFAGGNRQHGFTLSLNIEAVIKDMDSTPDLQKSLRPAIAWSCVNSNKQRPCTDLQNNLIKFDETSLIQNFPPKLFEPYSAYQFNLDISLNQKATTISVLIAVMELASPLLVVHLPEILTQQKVNLNDYISVSIDYSKPPDEVFLSLIFIYDYDIVATKKQEFKTFKFKIWEMYSSFSILKDELFLKVSLYDPEFFMPFSCNYKLQLNYAPQGGTLSVTPAIGEAISTQFVISMDNFIDQDMPLSYRLYYYMQEKDLEDEIEKGSQPMSTFYNQMGDYSSSNTYTTFLPRASVSKKDGTSQKMIILAQISDSQGAFTNITQTIIVNSPTLTINEQLDNINSIYEQALKKSDVQQVIDLNFLAMELNQIQKFSCASASCAKNSKRSLSVQENIETQTIYSDMSKLIYDKINEFMPKISSQILLDQMMKCKNLILESGNLLSDVSPEELNSGIDDLANLVNKQQEDMETVLATGRAFSGDSEMTQKMTKISNLQSKTTGILDKMFAAINTQPPINSSDNTNSSDSRQLNNITSNSTKLDIKTKQIESLFNVTQNIQKSLFTNSLPNESPVEFVGSEFSMQIQKQTAKEASKIGSRATSFQDEFQNITSDIASFDADENATVHDIYNLVFNSFRNNPYKDDEYFSNQSTQTNVTQPMYDISLKKGVFQQAVKVTQPVLMDIQAQTVPGFQQDAVTNECVQKDIDYWSNDFCQTVKKQDAEGKDYYTCECSKLQPTTLFSTLKQAAINSNVTTIFTMDNFLDFAKIKFWEYTIFYVFAVQTFLYLLLVNKGNQQDEEFFEQQKIIPLEKLQAEQRVEELNKDYMQQQQKKIFQFAQQRRGLRQQKIGTQTKDQSDLNMIITLGDVQERNLDTQKKTDNDQAHLNDHSSSSLPVIHEVTINQDDNNNQEHVEDLDQNISPSPIKFHKDNRNNTSFLSSILNNVDRINEQKQEPKDQKQEPSEQKQEPETKDVSHSNLIQKKQYIRKYTTEKGKLDEDDKDIENKQVSLQLTDKEKFTNSLMLHELLSVFFFNDPNLSRAVRYTMQYLKITVLMTLTLLNKGSQLMTLITSVLIALIVTIPVALIQLLFKFRFTKWLGVILSISLFALCFYICTLFSSFMGVEAANQWAYQYLFGWILDCFVIQVILAITKLSIFNKTLAYSHLCIIQIIQKIILLDNNFDRMFNEL